uniref:AAA+ ATPase domain-containing protein n=1 Tax=Fagus sylvatica TaxID=28930 RepID=A0A2N9FBV4_FAGSY
MDVVSAAVGAVCGCFCSKINTAVNLPSRLDVLVREMERLVDLREQVKLKKEAAEKEGNEIRSRVIKWLHDVEKLELRVNPIQEQMHNNKKPSACFLNCSKRYRESREVEEILEEIKRLVQVVENIPDVVYSTTIYWKRSIRSQTTASKALDKTMRLLYNDRVARIGIWGLGGVGKTTLVRALNNELVSSSTQPFGIVIWATVSKSFDLRQVQKQIAERLNLEVEREESEQRVAIRLHWRLVNEEKFLLILDDVWEKIDLDILGVPQPKVHRGCKIILTSRSMEVCRSMFTDFEVKIDVLNDEEAWQLFCQKAEDVFNDEKIKPLAEAIVRECCGLPLAIILVGAAMRRKEKVELWEHALNELRRSVPFVEDIEVEVYKPLKWSYDSLQGNNIKSCFLYCSLFPEDYSIEIIELVQHWLGEGLIDEQLNHLDSINTGMDLIEKLKDSCLLQDGADEGTVKMYVVVRDFAIWIASSSEDGDKSLVRSGIGLREISVEDFSNSDSLRRVSFMSNEITKLPDCEIKCSKASTLLLQDNRSLEIVPERFLQGFVALKVLNLSETSIQSLPVSIMQLGDLRALLLRDCSFLGELPPLGELSRLEMLDLSGTCIRELSKEMGNLSNLRQLHLSHTYHLETIPAGIISKLSCLEVLDMTDSAYEFLVEGEITFEELRFLNRLLFLSISFKRIPHLSSEDLSWIKRLRGFQIFIDPKRGSSSVISTINDKGVTFSNVDISQGSVGQLWGIAKSLKFVNCEGLNEKIIDLGINSVGYFADLKSLEICIARFDRRNGGVAAQCDLLPNLEELTLSNLEGLESISELVAYLGLRFLSLKLIEVEYCYDMKYLLSCGDFIRTLPKLEVIKVDACNNLYELFNYDSGLTMALDPVVPNLRKLKLKSLPKLRTLCRNKETWLCLQQVEVLECDRLKRLPLTNQNAGTVKAIIGESEWWDALEWDDEETKSNLLPYFRPTLPEF